MSGPQGLVKCCLKVLGFELPSCLVKGFFPLFYLRSAFSAANMEKGSPVVFAYQNKLAVFILPSKVPTSHSHVIRTCRLLLKTPHYLVVAALIPQVPSQGEVKGPCSCRGRIKFRAVFLLGEEAGLNGNTGVAKFQFLVG